MPDEQLTLSKRQRNHKQARQQIRPYTPKAPDRLADKSRDDSALEIRPLLQRIRENPRGPARHRLHRDRHVGKLLELPDRVGIKAAVLRVRSEERRVGKEGKGRW